MHSARLLLCLNGKHLHSVRSHSPKTPGEQKWTKKTMNPIRRSNMMNLDASSASGKFKFPREGEFYSRSFTFDFTSLDLPRDFPGFGDGDEGMSQIGVKLGVFCRTQILPHLFCLCRGGVFVW